MHVSGKPAAAIASKGTLFRGKEPYTGRARLPLGLSRPGPCRSCCQFLLLLRRHALRGSHVYEGAMLASSPTTQPPCMRSLGLKSCARKSCPMNSSLLRRGRLQLRARSQSDGVVRVHSATVRFLAWSAQAMALMDVASVRLATNHYVEKVGCWFPGRCRIKQYAICWSPFNCWCVRRPCWPWQTSPR